MKVIKYLSILSAVIVTLFVALLLFVNLVDVDRYKKPIEKQVSKVLGRKLVIEGDSDLKIFLHPRVVLQGVRLQNAPWGSRPDMVDVQKVELQVALIPLLRGELEIEKFYLIEPDILLETDADGQANWAFQVEEPAAEPPPREKEQGGGVIVSLEEIRMEKARLVYRDGVTGKSSDTVVDDLTINLNDSGRLDWHVAADYNRIPLKIDGTTDRVSSLLRNQPWTAELATEIGGMDISINSKLQQPMDMRGIDVQTVFKTENLDTMAQLAETELPAFGPIELQGKLNDAGDDYGFELTGTAETVKLAADGKLARSLDGKGLAVKLSVEAPDTAPIARLAGTELPKLGPVNVGGTISAVDGQYKAALTGGLAEIKADLDGQIAQTLDPDGLSARVNLQAPSLEHFSKLVGTDLPPLAPVKVSANVADSGAFYKVLLKGEAGRINLGADGQVADSLDGKGMDIDVTLQAPDLRTLGEVAATDLPPVGPVDVRAKLTDIEGGQKISGLQAKLGSSDVSGEVEVAHQAEPMRIAANLTSKLLDVSPFEKGEDSQQQQATAKSTAKADKDSGDKVFPGDPLPVDQLKGIDADIRYKANKIQSASADLANVEVGLRLANGKLELAPLKADTVGGTIKADATLDASKSRPDLHASINANKIQLGELKQVKDVMSGGSTRVAVNVSGAGNSVREIAAGLNGKALVDVGKGELKNKSINLAGADLLAQLVKAINPFSKGSDTTRLDCAVVNFDIKDGVARTQKGIAVETDSMFIVGDGDIDLRSEQIDIQVRTRSRGGVGVGVGDLAKVVGIGGTLAAPSPALDVKGVASTGATVGAAVATGGISLIAQKAAEKVVQDDSPCQTALGEKSTR